jgi:hypothetical protein
VHHISEQVVRRVWGKLKNERLALAVAREIAA